MPLDTAAVLLVVGFVLTVTWLGWLCWCYYRGHHPRRELYDWWRGSPPSDTTARTVDDDLDSRSRRP
jgi:hypothetical protein